MNNIITFYSYKGGVGRTMSLVNTALVMAGWGLKVLIIDWDLEAPGIEYFFAPYLKESLLDGSTGIIDLLEGKLALDNWPEAVNPVDLRTPGNIDYISSGKRDPQYFERVRTFDLDAFYKVGGGQTIETLREQWAAAYDFVLIDSRTGVTEMGGVCTIQLPDIVVLLFTATEQGFEGALDIARRSARSQQLMPFSRQKLVYLPVPSRLDQSEFKLTELWLDTFAEQLNFIYMDWLPKSINQKEFLKLTKIPYIPYFSFGEKLPVLEQGTNDPAGLGYAYETIAALLVGKLENINLFINQRDNFIKRAQQRLVSIVQHRDKKVFISYASSDSELVIALTAYLRNHYAHISLFTADNINPGELVNYDKDFFFDVDIIIYILSDDYYNSKTAMQEMFILQQLTEESAGKTKEIRLKKIDADEHAALSDFGNLKFIEAANQNYLPITPALENIK